MNSERFVYALIVLIIIIILICFIICDNNNKKEPFKPLKNNNLPSYEYGLQFAKLGADTLNVKKLLKTDPDYTFKNYIQNSLSATGNVDMTGERDDKSTNILTSSAYINDITFKDLTDSTIQKIIDIFYPVGSIFITTSSTTESPPLPAGTWTLINKTLYLCTCDNNKYTAGSYIDATPEEGKTKGSWSLTKNTMPAHSHTLKARVTSDAKPAADKHSHDVLISNYYDVNDYIKNTQDGYYTFERNFIHKDKLEDNIKNSNYLTNRQSSHYQTSDWINNQSLETLYDTVKRNYGEYALTSLTDKDRKNNEYYKKWLKTTISEKEWFNYYPIRPLPFCGLFNVPSIRSFDDDEKLKNSAIMSHLFKGTTHGTRKWTAGGVRDDGPNNVSSAKITDDTTFTTEKGGVLSSDDLEKYKKNEDLSDAWVTTMNGSHKHYLLYSSSQKTEEHEDDNKKLMRYYGNENGYIRGTTYTNNWYDSDEQSQPNTREYKKDFGDEDLTAEKTFMPPYFYVCAWKRVK